MPARELKDFLDSQNVAYTSIYHSAFYTAQEIAASAHIAGRILAKTVVVKLDGKMAMIVLPADHRIDLDRVKETLGARTVELAKEEEFQERFTGCHIGAMPPFGNRYGMAVFADRSLAENEMIVFNAGTHYELIKMKYRDFERLVQPKVDSFSLKLKA